MARKIMAFIAGGVVLCVGIYLWNQTEHTLAAFIVSLLGLAIAVGSLFAKPPISKRIVTVGGSMRGSEIEFCRSEEKYPTDDRLEVGKDVEDSVLRDVIIKKEQHK